MSDGLAGSFELEVIIWLAFVLGLGGAGAVATGRALAGAWQPLALLVPYALLLAAVTGFLCWALFGLPVIPAARIVARIAEGDWEEAALGLSGLVMTFALLWPLGAFGFMFTRARQMRSQYPFLAEDGERPEKL